MTYKLPSLPYDYGALEPYIDTLTMEIHHTKHHQGYVNKLNAALENQRDLQKKSLEELLKNPATLPQEVRIAIQNNGGGHFNHSLFWRVMKKNGGDLPVGKVGADIVKFFRSYEEFQDQFNKTAKTVFGSGWAWLCVDHEGKLVITSTPNQDTPISNGLQPVLGLDVWEHAYYLQYQNKRPDYINAWWHVINWEQVESNYQQIIG